MVTRTKTYSLSAVIEGYLMSLGARHLSQNTVDDYTRTLHKFATFLVTDPPVHEITSKHVEQFLASFKDLSNKSLLNYHIGLSALWTWLVREEIVSENIIRKLTPPKPTKKEVVPFTEAEVKAMLSALNRSKVYRRDGRNVDHALGSMERNRAILLLMLDTGLRASELCELKIEDLDTRNHRIFVRMGKGMKERLLPFSPRTGQMLWRYLAGRKDTQPGDPLFVGRLNRPITRTKLAEMCAGIGKRAGVQNVHPHRFRHTFAIQYLRNGGNAYTLQMMLGHSSFESVRIYLRLAQVDLDTVHRRASPVDGWRL
jgi:site-specific recombinase XerD